MQSQQGLSDAYVIRIYIRDSWPLIGHRSEHSAPIPSGRMGMAYGRQINSPPSNPMCFLAALSLVSSYSLGFCLDHYLKAGRVESA